MTENITFATPLADGNKFRENRQYNVGADVIFLINGTENLKNQIFNLTFIFW